MLIIWVTVLIGFCLMSTGCAQPSNGSTGVPGQSIVGPQGPQGGEGPTGPKGDDGLNGSTGPKGDTGVPGQDATPVTVIKLCPDTAEYPSVFVEYAICLQNELYAVYSTHGGFLALIPPGRYSSNGVGSSCSFTVVANCGVVNE